MPNLTRISYDIHCDQLVAQNIVKYFLYIDVNVMRDEETYKVMYFDIYDIDVEEEIGDDFIENYINEDEIDITILTLASENRKEEFDIYNANIKKTDFGINISGKIKNGITHDDLLFFIEMTQKFGYDKIHFRHAESYENDYISEYVATKIENTKVHNELGDLLVENDICVANEITSFLGQEYKLTLKMYIQDVRDKFLSKYYMENKTKEEIFHPDDDTLLQQEFENQNLEEFYDIYYLSGINHTDDDTSLQQEFENQNLEVVYDIYYPSE